MLASKFCDATCSRKASLPPLTFDKSSLASKDAVYGWLHLKHADVNGVSSASRAAGRPQLHAFRFHLLKHSARHPVAKTGLDDSSCHHPPPSSQLQGAPHRKRCQRLIQQGSAQIDATPDWPRDRWP